MSDETVGFVGVGLMGHGMAKNILHAGYPLFIIANRNRKSVDSLVEIGATEVKSLSELAEKSSVVFICAPASPDVEQIVKDMLPFLKPGNVVVDCTTADPTSTMKVAAQLQLAGIDFADAPLGGTPVQAEAGELHAMVGAKDAVFARLIPVISAWAGKTVHIGKIGDGHRMKLLNNFLSLGYAGIYSEALALSQKVGLSPEKFDSVIRGSRMDCGFYQTFMGYALEGDREAHKFTLKNAAKDMTYLASMANAAQVANPIGNEIKNAFVRAVNTGGDGPEDYVPMLPEIVGKQNGVDLRPNTKNLED